MACKIFENQVTIAGVGNHTVTYNYHIVGLGLLYKTCQVSAIHTFILVTDVIVECECHTLSLFLLVW